MIPTILEFASMCRVMLILFQKWRRIALTAELSQKFLKKYIRRFITFNCIIFKKNWSHLTRTRNFCEFEHMNVGHKHTRNASAIHACFPTIPTSMEIEIPCPTNSSAYFWDTPTKMISRVCLDNGTWGVSLNI